MGSLGLIAPELPEEYGGAGTGSLYSGIVIEEIARASEGVMVARGDLGVEVPAEDVPLLQKRIIRAANERRIPVITATQMLESMETTHKPTRAEATDVANAIYDGTDVVMLSGETSSGRHAVESVRMMRRIIRFASAPVMPIAIRPITNQAPQL